MHHSDTISILSGAYDSSCFLCMGSRCLYSKFGFVEDVVRIANLPKTSSCSPGTEAMKTSGYVVVYGAKHRPRRFTERRVTKGLFAMHLLPVRHGAAVQKLDLTVKTSPTVRSLHLSIDTHAWNMFSTHGT